MASGTVDQAAVMAALGEFKDPETGRSVTQMEQVRDVQVDGDALSLTLALTTHSAALAGNEVGAGAIAAQPISAAQDGRCQSRGPLAAAAKDGQHWPDGQERDRRRLRQRGRRQKHDRRQPGAGFGAPARKSACSMPTCTVPAFRICLACTASRSARAKIKSNRSTPTA